MPTALDGGAEQVGIASIGKLELLTQLRRCERKIAYGDIRPPDPAQQPPHILLAHASNRFDGKPAPWKIRHGLSGHKQVTIRSDLRHTIPFLQQVETAGFIIDAFGSYRYSISGNGAVPMCNPRAYTAES